MYLKNDTTDDVSIYAVSQKGFSPASQKEIDAYLLVQKKRDEVTELKTELKRWRNAGFLYNEWIFNLSESSATYVKAKNDGTWGGPDRYKFSDMTYTQRDFGDDAGFNEFAAAIEAEEDRVMVLYNNYRGQIAVFATGKKEGNSSFSFDFNP